MYEKSREILLKSVPFSTKLDDQIRNTFQATVKNNALLEIILNLRFAFCKLKTL